MTPWPALPEKPKKVGKYMTYQGRSFLLPEEADRRYQIDCNKVHAERERILRGLLEEAMAMLMDFAAITKVDVNMTARLYTLRERIAATEKP